MYHEMYEEFKLHEFEGVVKKFGYTHTRNNLIMSFRKYIPEYIPKNVTDGRIENDLKDTYSNSIAFKAVGRGLKSRRSLQNLGP